MDAKELRIGNLIQGKKYKTALTVRVIDANFLCVEPVPNYENDVLQIDNLDEVEGIPLTEELFKKLGNGFSFAENFSCYWYDGCVCIEQFGEGTEKLEHIKYVHQYQNFHYALTNTELTINL